MTSPGTLTTLPHDPWLDMDPWIGQRHASFRFQLIHGPSGQELAQLTPVKVATIRHTTGQAIARQCSAQFDVTDTARINTLTDRVLIWMVLRGQQWPLGRFMFVDQTRLRSTAGIRSDTTMVDEAFLVDQKISQSFAAPGTGPARVADTIPIALSGLPVQAVVEPSPYYTVGVWPIGTRRGQIMEDLSVDGDYWSPYFGNDGRYHFKRTFDPATVVPTFDFDTGRKVIRSSIAEVDDALVAANRFVVIGNGAVGSDPDTPIVGTYDIPASAPHSIEQRGFVVLEQQERQLASSTQAQAVAINLGQRQTIYERAELSTAPDPRHDGYDVVRWRGDNWLELGWELVCAEGAPMRHVLRKAYLP